MAKCKSGKCGCRTRVVSDAVNSINKQGCFDICKNPICGSPDYLGIFAPLIYDEIGINLCTTFDLGIDIPLNYPTATNISAQVIDVGYEYGDGNVDVSPISGRPNCYSVVLANLSVTFAINVYDANCRLLDTIYTTVLYLPTDTTSPTYDEDTNPASVELEIFAPYGVSYNEGAEAGTYTYALNNIAFLSADNYVRQGINLYTIPKVLNFDEDDSTATIGITLVLQSLYFSGYRVPSAGKINIPKGCILPADESACMKFVAGELLDLAIKPLDLGEPNYEECLKKECTRECKNDCITDIDID